MTVKALRESNNDALGKAVYSFFLEYAEQFSLEEMPIRHHASWLYTTTLNRPFKSTSAAPCDSYTFSTESGTILYMAIYYT